MFVLPKWTDAAARALMSLLFLVSGIGKLTDSAVTQDYMAAHGVPGLLVWPAAAWEIAGGILLLIGLWTRPLALLLAAWCILTAAIFHTAIADQNQIVNFLKNLTMAGGFLSIARTGALGVSVDALHSSRRNAVDRPT